MKKIEFLAKAFMNKRNKQISILIPKKKIQTYRLNKPPKRIRLEVKEIEW